MTIYDRIDSRPNLGFLTLQNLANQLEISERTVRRWVAKGHLPAPRRLGRQCFWPAQAIRDALSVQREGKI